MPPNVSTAAKPKPKGDGKGKKVLGMDRKVAVLGGLALAGGVLFIIWRNRQGSAASSGTDTTGAGADTSALPDSSGVQGGGMQGATGTETLVIKIRELQGHKRKPPVSHPIGKPKPHKRPKGHTMRPPHVVAGGPPWGKTTGPPRRG